jgi:hypothetical protein
MSKAFFFVVFLLNSFPALVDDKLPPMEKADKIHQES